jgi:hypothetical protein
MHEKRQSVMAVFRLRLALSTRNRDAEIAGRCRCGIDQLQKRGAASRLAADQLERMPEDPQPPAV